MASERLKSAFIIVLVLLLGIGLAIFLYFYQVLYENDVFLPGVRIGEVLVAGYSRNEASALLRDNIELAYNASIVFYSGSYSSTKRLADLSDPIDIEKLLSGIEEKERKRSLLSKISNMDGSKVINYPIKIPYTNKTLAQLSAEWNKALSCPAENARLEMDLEQGLIVVPSKKGSKVNETVTFNGLPQELESFESLKIPIVLTVINPEVNEGELQDMGELSVFSTWFNASDINRSHNLYLATARINGVMIDPGEVFSFNLRVGQRVSEAGYRDALVIVGNKFEPGLGGGVCQVSSTLYNAVLLAGLQIVERHNHALTVAYVPVGRDATVVYGLQDFRFKNTTGHPIYIRSIARGGRLQINVYGNLAAKQRITLNSVIDQTIAFKESRQIDETLPPGKEKLDHVGFPGYVSRTFRNYLNQEGKIIKTEKLSSDYYKPLDKLILTGSLTTGEQPDTELETTPEKPDAAPAQEKPGDEPGPVSPEVPKDKDPALQEPAPLNQTVPEIGI